MQKRLIIEAIGRLPGPLAGKLLKNNGHAVIKIEDVLRPDPFSTKVDDFLSPMFNCWYEKLKQEKICFKLNDGDLSQWQELTNYFDQFQEFIILTPIGKCPLKKTIESIKLYIRENEKNYQEIKIGSDRLNTPLHDLDIAGKLEILNSKSQKPFQYPLMGIQFASQIALQCLSTACLNETQILYFEDEIFKTFSLISDGKKNYPIQGNIIAYNIYQLDDSKITLTAMENRSWLNFIEKIQINLNSDDRFSQIKSVPYKKLQTRLLEMKRDELEKLIPAGEMRCFTFI